MKIKEMMEKRNDLLSEMDGILKKSEEETRALQEEETARCSEIETEIRALDDTIKTYESRQKLQRLECGESTPEEEKRALDDEKAFISFVQGETRALDVANNNSIIPTTIASRIIEKVKELSPIYSMVSIYNVGGDLAFPMYDDSADTGAALVEDMAELTESAGKFTTVTLKNHIVGVLKLVSKSLLNRTDFDLVSFIVQKVAENIAEFLENALLNGEFGKYVGAFETQNLVTAAAATSVTTDELIDVQMTVPQQFQSNSVWLMNKDSFKKIMKLKDSDGNYLLNRDLTNGFGWSLLGKPVYVSENAPKMAGGKTAIVYGDPSGLYVKLAQGMEIQVLLEKYATRHAIGVVGYVEFDSNIIEPQKLAGLKMKASA